MATTGVVQALVTCYKPGTCSLNASVDLVGGGLDPPFLNNRSLLADQDSSDAYNDAQANVRDLPEHLLKRFESLHDAYHTTIGKIKSRKKSKRQPSTIVLTHDLGDCFFQKSKYLVWQYI